MREADTVIIDVLSIADYDSLRALWASIGGIVLRSADSRPAVARYLDRNPGLSFVARRNGRLVGGVLSGHDGRRGYLHHLAVEPAERRRGIASALVERCLDALERAGIEKIHIDVLANNTSAQQFWARAGWQKRYDIVRFSFLNSADTNA
jgi:N-acetylglutamate synthase